LYFFLSNADNGASTPVDMVRSEHFVTLWLFVHFDYPAMNAKKQKCSAPLKSLHLGKSSAGQSLDLDVVLFI
jgi:hypothetical protein